jgi:hypothetical protein
MSAVRDELWRVLSTPPNNMTHAGAWSKADAILERFDVTPKPVVTEQELGLWCEVSFVGEVDRASVGKKFLGELKRAGLVIVRLDE